MATLREKAHDIQHNDENSIAQVCKYGRQGEGERERECVLFPSREREREICRLHWEDDLSVADPCSAGSWLTSFSC